MGFSEFLGNERIVAALRGALRSGRVPHALLFTGPRGVEPESEAASVEAEIRSDAVKGEAVKASQQGDDDEPESGGKPQKPAIE